MNLRTAIVGPLLALAVAGCGGSGGDSGGPKTKPGSAPEGTQVKRRTADSLPKIGEYLPPQDEGRIEIAPPADWKAMPRDARYLARFVHGKVSELPRITITVWDTPLPDITELTEANADKLAAELTAQLKKDKKTVPEPPRPIILGETLFLRHVRRAKLASGGNVVIQALDTIRGGRIYTVELIADIDAARAEEYEASLTKWRDDGYAVAANLKFSGDATIPETTTPETTTPETTTPETTTSDPPAETPAPTESPAPAESNP